MLSQRKQQVERRHPPQSDAVVDTLWTFTLRQLFPHLVEEVSVSWVVQEGPQVVCGPAAAPRLDFLKFVANMCSSSRNLSTGSWSRMVAGKSSLGRGGRRLDPAVPPMFVECQEPAQLLPKLVCQLTTPPSVPEPWHALLSVSPVSAALPALSCGGIFSALPACSQQTHPPTFHEILGKFGLVDFPTNGRSEQKQTWQKHEQLPPSLSSVLVKFVGFLQSQPHGAAERPSQKLRHNLHDRSSSGKFHQQINRVQLHQCGSDRWCDTSRRHHHWIRLCGWDPRGDSLPTRRPLQMANSPCLHCHHSFHDPPDRSLDPQLQNRPRPNELLSLALAPQLFEKLGLGLRQTKLKVNTSIFLIPVRVRPTHPLRRNPRDRTL